MVNIVIYLNFKKLQEERKDMALGISCISKKVMSINDNKNSSIYLIFYSIVKNYLCFMQFIIGKPETYNPEPNSNFTPTNVLSLLLRFEQVLKLCLHSKFYHYQLHMLYL